MKIEERIYFMLLRRALWGEESVGSGGVPIGGVGAETLPASVMTLAMRQGTGAIVAEQIMKSGEASAALKMICGRNMMQRERLMGVLKKAWKALEDAGIRPVLLKGFGLAENYPQPDLRQYGDIDIFVGKEAYHEGAKVLREAFPEALHFDEEAEYFKHYNLLMDDISIEMHRVSAAFSHPRDARIYDELESAAMREAECQQWWRAPEVKFNILFVFFHSWEHWLSEGACIRQIVDLMMLIKSARERKIAGLDEYLEKNLKRLHLMRVWKLYAYVMVQHLGLKKEDCPLYDGSVGEAAEKMLRRVLEGKDAAPKEEEKAPKNVILRKMYTLRVRIREAKEIAKVEPGYARHMIATAFAQSWERFKLGQNTRKWE